MGFALHQMYVVLGLVMGDLLCVEYIPTTEGLHLIKKDAPLLYETYWKVLCHFHTCTQTIGLRSEGIRQMAWASYLFQGLSDKTDPVSHLAPSTDAEIEEKIDASVSSCTSESNEDIFQAIHDL